MDRDEQVGVTVGTWWWRQGLESETKIRDRSGLSGGGVRCPDAVNGLQPPWCFLGCCHCAPPRCPSSPVPV